MFLKLKRFLKGRWYKLKSFTGNGQELEYYCWEVFLPTEVSLHILEQDIEHIFKSIFVPRELPFIILLAYKQYLDYYRDVLPEGILPKNFSKYWEIKTKLNSLTGKAKKSKRQVH